MASGNRLMPTDLEMVAYLKVKAESRELSIPTWVVHKVDFWNYGPQKLAKDFPAASDGSWYFVSTRLTCGPIPYDGWKELDIPTSEKYVYNQGNPVAYKYQRQRVDDNNQEWRMWIYRAFDPVSQKLRTERLAKMYKHNPDAINQASKRLKCQASAPVKFMPTDADACAYLKLKMESRSLSIPGWVVHELDFWKHKPQQLAEAYEPAKDQGQTWYFVSPNRAKWSEWAVYWKILSIPLNELVIHHRGDLPAGLKLECEFLDENNQKWHLCFYLSFNLHAKEKRETSPGVLGKLKRIEEEERCLPGNKTIDIKECNKETLT